MLPSLVACGEGLTPAIGVPARDTQWFRAIRSCCQRRAAVRHDLGVVFGTYEGLGDHEAARRRRIKKAAKMRRGTRRARRDDLRVRLFEG